MWINDGIMLKLNLRDVFRFPSLDGSQAVKAATVPITRARHVDRGSDCWEQRIITMKLIRRSLCAMTILAL